MNNQDVVHNPDERALNKQIQIRSQLHRQIQHKERLADLQDDKCPQIELKTVTKQKASPNQLLSNNIKSRADILSGYSFSRFEAISESSEKDKFSDSDSVLDQPKCDFSKKRVINKVCTSTKAISSNKIIEEPIEVRICHQNQFNGVYPSEKKNEYTFQYNYISSSQILLKFSKFAISRGMESIAVGDKVRAIKRIPLLKSILSLCFPNTDLDHQIYELTCQPNRHCKLSLESGKAQNYFCFQEDFLLSLWQEKFLMCGSLHQNLRHFVRHFNNQRTGNDQNSMKQNHKSKSQGQIDTLRTEIQKNVMALSAGSDEQFHIRKQNQSKNTRQSVQLDQMRNLKLKIKQMQCNLKIQLEEEMEKQEVLKNHKKQKTNQEQLGQFGTMSVKNEKKDKKKELVTPSTERMLLSIFYTHLSLEQLVKKSIVRQKDIGEFQKKKMIIKGTLNTFNIFNYLELEQFSKILQPHPAQSNLLSHSIKILSSLKCSSYPSPAQIFEVIAVFKNTLLKEIQSCSKQANSAKVKMQDHTNQQRTLLQFGIFCLIMCQNRDIYSTIQTAIIFYPFEDSNFVSFPRESLLMAKILRRGINFIQNEWQL